MKFRISDCHLRADLRLGELLKPARKLNQTWHRFDALNALNALISVSKVLRFQGGIQCKNSWLLVNLVIGLCLARQELVLCKLRK